MSQSTMLSAKITNKKVFFVKTKKEVLEKLCIFSKKSSRLYNDDSAIRGFSIIRPGS